jgi:hypothetical protein
MAVGKTNDFLLVLLREWPLRKTHASSILNAIIVQRSLFHRPSVLEEAFSEAVGAFLSSPMPTPTAARFAPPM